MDNEKELERNFNIPKDLDSIVIHGELIEIPKGKTAKLTIELEQITHQKGIIHCLLSSQSGEYLAYKQVIGDVNTYESIVESLSEYIRERKRI